VPRTLAPSNSRIVIGWRGQLPRRGAGQTRRVCISAPFRLSLVSESAAIYRLPQGI
jgi:hypothetical protein